MPTRERIEEMEEEMWESAMDFVRGHIAEDDALAAAGAACGFMLDALRVLSMDGDASEHVRMFASLVVARVDAVYSDIETQEATSRIARAIESPPREH